MTSSIVYLKTNDIPHKECENKDETKCLHEFFFLLDKKSCSKNPGHKDFFPYKLIHYLLNGPELLFVKHVGQRTVKLQVCHLSSRRPDHNNKDPNQWKHYGTGFLTKLASRDTLKDIDITPNTEYFIIITANHVIFDDSEAEKTRIKFFNDDADEDGVKEAEGIKVIEGHLEHDYVFILCRTFDRDLILRFKYLFSLPQLPSSFDFKSQRSSRQSQSDFLAKVCFTTLSKLSFVYNWRIARFYTHLTRWLRENRTRFPFLEISTLLVDLTASNQRIQTFFTIYVEQAKLGQWSGELFDYLRSESFTKNSNTINSFPRAFTSHKEYAINTLLMCHSFDEFCYTLTFIAICLWHNVESITFNNKEIGVFSDPKFRTEDSEKKQIIACCSVEDIDTLRTFQYNRDSFHHGSNFKVKNVDTLKTANIQNKEPKYLFTSVGPKSQSANLNLFEDLLTWSLWTSVYNISIGMPDLFNSMKYRSSRSKSFSDKLHGEQNNELYFKEIRQCRKRIESLFIPNWFSRKVPDISNTFTTSANHKCRNVSNAFFSGAFLNHMTTNSNMIEFQEQYGFPFNHFEKWINKVIQCEHDNSPEFILSILVSVRFLEISSIDTVGFIEHLLEEIYLNIVCKSFNSFKLLVSPEFANHLHRVCNTAEMQVLVKKFRLPGRFSYDEFVDNFTSLLRIVKDNLRGFFKLCLNGMELSTGAVFHISHPHGKEKHITIGEKTDEGGFYRHNAATCKGGSGGPVCFLSVDCENTKPIIAPHRGFYKDLGLGVTSSVTVNLEEC